MTTSKTPTIPTDSPRERKQLDNQLSSCILKWRQGKLLVNFRQQIKQPHLPSLESKQWLVECLQHSPVRLIRIDTDLGEARLKFWADACEQANKPVFLRVTSACELPNKRYPLSWCLKRILDKSVAALLLLILSPLVFGLFVLMRIQSPEPVICWQWCVGERGKLFRLFKFPTQGKENSLPEWENDPQITRLGRWMRKNNLEELPQLLNVLRGELSLVGPCPLTLCDVVQIKPDLRQQLNVLPGITGSWQIKTRSKLPSPDLVSRCDLEDLRSWSLSQDLKIFLLTILKMISNTAY